MNNLHVIFENKTGESPRTEIKTNEPPRTVTPTIQLEPDEGHPKSSAKSLEDILEAYSQYQRKLNQKINSPRLKIGEVLSSLAFIYEKVRNTLDYKGEHLLRRNAIERILRRLLWEKRKYEPKSLALSLVRELIWSRYLENDSLPTTKIDEVAAVISKYLLLLPKTATNNNGQNGLKTWLVGISSCEIEEVLDPKLSFDYHYLQAVDNWFQRQFEWADDAMPEAEKKVQSLIAIDRALLKSDQPWLRYHLLKIECPDWQNLQEESLKKISEETLAIQERIEAKLNNPIQLRLYRFAQQQIAPFQIMKELIEQDPDGFRTAINNPPELEDKIHALCETKYSQIDKKVRRGIARSIIYILVTKVFLAFLLEFPYEVWVVKKINPVPLMINILLPPTLMYVVGLTIRKPDKKNTVRIIERIKSFIYPEVREDKIKFSLFPSKKSVLMENIFSFIYLLLFIITFGGLMMILRDFHFNIVSSMVFFVFLSLVLLFGFRVRFTASELIVTGEKEGFFAHVITNLSLPLLNLGAWLSRSLAKLNFLIIFMDFLIEAPLKNIIEVVEEWTSFIKERKEEVVQIPES